MALVRVIIQRGFSRATQEFCFRAMPPVGCTDRKGHLKVAGKYMGFDTRA
jgi:hypothetical protein